MTSNPQKPEITGRLVTLAVGLLVCSIGLLQPVSAQPAKSQRYSTQNQAAADPPGRVGRLAEVQGVVWLLHPEEGEWISAVRNRPLTSGDRLSTEAGARAELWIGSTALRLDGDTDIEIGRIDDQAIEVVLQSGSIAMRVRNDEAARGLVLRTDDGDFSPVGSGSYRLDAQDTSSELTVWAGQAMYNGPQSALTIYQGQRAAFWIDANQRAQYSLGQPRFDSFASWSSGRDRLADNRSASRHISPEMTGAEDLDRYGRWSEDPEYGALWAPNQVPVGWRPYAAGHWAWVSPWGWSWVDDAPWGFAPFHYGRWIAVDNRWFWAPGRYEARPIYAPALVGWIGGTGASVSFTIGGGRGIGWFPLAPREAFLPTYRFSRGYARDLNGPHFRNHVEFDRLIQTPSPQRGIEYSNRKFHHGTTAIPIEAFMRRGGGSGRVEIEPRWRDDRPSRELNRMPGTAVVTAPPPAWQGRGDERRSLPERPGVRVIRDMDRQAGRSLERETGAEARPAPWVGGERRDGRRDGRGGDDGARPRHDAEPGRPPFVGIGAGGAGNGFDNARPPVGMPPQATRPSGRKFVNPDDQRGDGPANRFGHGQPPEAQQRARPVVEPPAAAVVTAPVASPQPMVPVTLPATRPVFTEGRQRPERPERIERPDRPDQRGGRTEQAMPAPIAERPAAAMPPPQIMPPPAPMMPSTPQQAARPMEAPRPAQPGDQGGRRTRDPRDKPDQPSMDERGGNVRDPRLGTRQRQDER